MWEQTVQNIRNDFKAEQSKGDRKAVKNANLEVKKN